MEAGIEQLRILTKAKSHWAILNIIDLESGKELLYVTNQEGREIVSNVLQVKFDNQGWSYLPKILLRKQIIPLVLR